MDIDATAINATEATNTTLDNTKCALIDQTAIERILYKLLMPGLCIVGNTGNVLNLIVLTHRS